MLKGCDQSKNDCTIQFVPLVVQFVRYVHPVLCGFSSGCAVSARVLWGFFFGLCCFFEQREPFYNIHKRILTWRAKVFNKIAPFVDPASFSLAHYHLFICFPPIFSHYTSSFNRPSTFQSFLLIQPVSLQLKMESHSTEELVRFIIRQHVRTAQVTNNSLLINDLRADEQDIAEIVMALEEKFDIDIPDEETEKLTTVQSVIDFVLKAQRG